MTPQLWSLPFSPWSDQTRWALDHCRVPYERRPYQPLLGEPAMRLRLRKWRGPVSVPVLMTDEGALSDSFDIAKWANARADEGRAIFIEGREAEIRSFDERGQSALAAGRVLGLRRILEDDEALGDLVPPNLGRALGPISLQVAAFGVRRTFRKYAAVTPRDLDRTLEEHLDGLREDLEAVSPDPDGNRYLLGTFSYADIVMAESLSFIVPPKTHLRLKDASRRAYTRAALAERAPGVFAWRDELFARRDPERRRRPPS